MPMRQHITHSQMNNP